jgi:hypothetical protein
MIGRLTKEELLRHVNESDMFSFVFVYKQNG